jgi:hypothetical protein
MMFINQKQSAQRTRLSATRACVLASEMGDGYIQPRGVIPSRTASGCTSPLAILSR